MVPALSFHCHLHFENSSSAQSWSSPFPFFLFLVKGFAVDDKPFVSISNLLSFPLLYFLYNMNSVCFLPNVFIFCYFEGCFLDIFFSYLYSMPLEAQCFRPKKHYWFNIHSTSSPSFSTYVSYLLFMFTIADIVGKLL